MLPKFVLSYHEWIVKRFDEAVRQSDIVALQRAGLPWGFGTLAVQFAVFSLVSHPTVRTFTVVGGVVVLVGVLVYLITTYLRAYVRARAEGRGDAG